MNVSQISVLHTLNLYSAACQLWLNKTGEKVKSVLNVLNIKHIIFWVEFIQWNLWNIIRIILILKSQKTYMCKNNSKS